MPDFHKQNSIDITTINSEETVLKVSSIGISFGGLRAVDNFSLHLTKGDLFGLIGPNGAGKTTVFNMLTGVYKPDAGDIVFSGKSIVGFKPHEISIRGMTRTFQNIRLFKELSVLDNVLLGTHQHVKYSLFDSVLKTPKYFKQEEKFHEKAFNILDTMGLKHKAFEISKNLPYGDQRRLEIARALATEPKLILLDEPAAGMNSQETHDLMDTIQRIRDDFHLTILLIEHDMKLVMGICEHILVLDYGVTIAQGNSVDIQNNPIVIEAYLGSDEVSK
ncbi:MAG TPA: ABC transporter ATP-binding protein [Thermodesulfovibrionia bacterium]|nr:ABC transporter ATP-binding protein [Thermodesulfovibrionia bacterium]